MTEFKYYVYELRDPRNGKPFYVGKGTGYRIASHLTEARQPKIKWTNAIKCERIQSIWGQGLEVIQHKVIEDVSEEEAFIKEDQLLHEYGLLINNTGFLTNVHSSSVPPKKGNTKRLTKSVVQYDINGKIIATFQSASSASTKTNIRISGILQCCKGNRNYAGGFRWGLVGECLKPVKECTYHKKRRRSVSQLSVDGILINEYESIKQAAALTGIDSGNIIACCKCYKHARTAGGFLWQYTNQSYTKSNSLS